MRIFGDFNLKYVNWDTETLCKPENIIQTLTSEEKESSNVLLDFVNENFLVQLVKENTRKGKSILDLVFASNEDIIFDINVESTNLGTDHDIVKFQILHKFIVDDSKKDQQGTNKKPIDKLNFEKADWNNIREDLSKICWSEVLTTDMSVDNMYS